MWRPRSNKKRTTTLILVKKSNIHVARKNSYNWNTTLCSLMDIPEQKSPWIFIHGCLISYLQLYTSHLPWSESMETWFVAVSSFRRHKEGSSSSLVDRFAFRPIGVDKLYNRIIYEGLNRSNVCSRRFKGFAHLFLSRFAQSRKYKHNYFAECTKEPSLHSINAARSLLSRVHGHVCKPFCWIELSQKGFLGPNKEIERSAQICVNKNKYWTVFRRHLVHTQ